MSDGGLFDFIPTSDKISLFNRFESIRETDVSKNIEANGLNVGQGVFSLKPSTTSEKWQTWPARQEAPKAMKLLQQKDSYLYLLSDQVEDFPRTRDVLQLFYPKGKSIYENVTLSEFRSSTGQPHVVNSYEEFVQYYKAPESTP